MKTNYHEKDIKSQPVQKIQETNKYDLRYWILPLLAFLIVGLHFSLVFVVRTTSSTDVYSYSSRMWGFDNIAFFPNYIIFTAYLIIVAICIPGINKKITDTVVSFFNQGFLSIIKISKSLVFILIAFVAALLIYSFRIKYHFLGDMDIRVQQTLDKNYIKDEFFTMFFIHYLHLVLNALLNFSGKQTFVFQSVMAGGFFIFFSLQIADILGKGYEKMIIFVYYISMGAILMFFGYLEIYSIPALMVTVYIYFMLLWIHNKTGFFIPLIVLILAISCHLLAIGLLPSYCIIFYKKYHEKFPYLKNIKTKHFIILVLLLLPVVFWIINITGITYLLPINNADDPRIMSLFSLKHIWEFLNYQLLSSGLSIFVLIFYAIKIIKARVPLVLTEWLLISSSFFMLFITFVAINMRGSGDWDVNAFPALVYNLLAVYFLVQQSRIPSQLAKIRYILLVFLAFNMMNALAWIGINASDKSIKKIALMLESDPGSYYIHFPSLLELGAAYEANELKDEALICFEKGYNKYPNDGRSYELYATLLYRMNNIPKALTIFEKMAKRFPYKDGSYLPLIIHYQANHQYAKTYMLVINLFNTYLKNPSYFKDHFNKKLLYQCFDNLYLFERDYKKNMVQANFVLSVRNSLN